MDRDVVAYQLVGGAALLIPSATPREVVGPPLWGHGERVQARLGVLAKGERDLEDLRAAVDRVRGEVAQCGAPGVNAQVRQVLDRLRTIVDESCGLQPADVTHHELLTLLEARIHDWHKTSEEREARAVAAEAERDVARREYAACAHAIGVEHVQDQGPSAPGPVEEVVAHIQAAVASEARCADLQAALDARAQRAPVFDQLVALAHDDAMRTERVAYEPFGAEHLEAERGRLLEEAAAAGKLRDSLLRLAAGAGGTRRKVIAQLAENAQCRAQRCRFWAEHCDKLIDLLHDEQRKPVAP